VYGGLTQLCVGVGAMEVRTEYDFNINHGHSSLTSDINAKG